MRRLLVVSLLVFTSAASAQERKAAKEADLKKQSSAAPDKSLAGDVTREKDKKQTAPALQYDQYRLDVELQVASKRHEQIDSLKKIISFADNKEKASLLFRLGELYWEESKFFFFEANRKDDDLIRAMNSGDKAAQERAKADKKELLARSKEFSALAIKQYSEIVQKYKDYERTDEVLYFLGHNLMEMGDDRRAMVAYKRLIEGFPKSKFIPDAHLAFGEYYFNNSKGKREFLEKALEAYKKAAAFPDSSAYGFALYKQGWCYFNLGDFQKAMDMFKAVILYGELAGAGALEKDGGKSGKGTLIREARHDFVRAYAQVGSSQDARAEFAKVASKPEDRFSMMKQLANIYYGDGKDREAAMTFDSLIREKPLSPEAPGFQGKIVDCLMRDGSSAGKKRTVNQVRRLVKITQDVISSGAVKDEKDKKALEEARELSERTLSNLAVNWHNEARKTRDEETFTFANEVYSDYLTLFPENPKAYELRFFWAELLHDNLHKFEKAADEYTKVMMQDVKRVEDGKKDGGKTKPGKFMVNAAYNAILAYDEVVKRDEEAGKIKTEPTSDPNKKVTIPPQKKALLEACERYLKYVPQGDKVVEIAFKAANIYYRHNHFDEAVQRFAEIALNHPEKKFETGERAAEVAANLVLDSYNLLGDWAKMNEWARKFYKDEKLASGKFREDLSKVIEQSAFKLVNQLEARKEYGKAAEAYLAFVSEFPNSEIADSALHNASVDFFQAKMLDRAIEVRKRIIANYPKSKHVPACIYANAEGSEAIGDFEEAAQSYEAYVAGYQRSLKGDSGGGRKKVAKRGKGAKGKAGKDDGDEKKSVQVWDEAKAQIALYNAGVFRAGLGQYKASLRDREQYLEMWPESKDAEAVKLALVDLHEKAGAYSKTLKELEEYERTYFKDPSKILAAEGRIVSLYEKLRKPRDADRVNRRILTYYEKLPSKLKKALEVEALDAVGKAHFASNDEHFRKYQKQKLRWGRLPNPATEFKRGLADKAKGLEAVQKAYTATVALKAADPAICALYKIGLAYDEFVSSLVSAPMPKGAPPELQDAIREELHNQAQPVKDKAAEAFAAAVSKSQELSVFNDCSAKSLKMLRETYRPDQYPPMFEDVATIKALEATQAVGQGLLASIQPIPVISASQAQENREKVKALQDEIGGVESIKKVDRDDDTPPGEDSAPSGKGGGRGARGAPPAEEEPVDSEPEDSL